MSATPIQLGVKKNCSISEIMEKIDLNKVLSKGLLAVFVLYLKRAYE